MSHVPAIAGIVTAAFIGTFLGYYDGEHAHPCPVASHPPLVQASKPCLLPKGVDMGSVACLDGEVVYLKPRIVYRWKPDINALLYKGHQICRGDMGLSVMLVFPSMPTNAEFLCGGQHEAYTDSGMRL